MEPVVNSSYAQVSIPGVKIQEDIVDFFGLPLARSTGGHHTPRISDFSQDAITEFELEFMSHLAICWNTQAVPCFEGGSGLGKSRSIRRMAAILNQDLYKIQGSADNKPEMVFGRIGIKPEFKGGLGFIENNAALAIMHGGILWRDEPNADPTELDVRLRDLTDAIISGRPYFELTEDHGERRIPIHPLTRVVYTQNEANGENPALHAIKAPDFGRLVYVRFPEILDEKIQADRDIKRLGFNPKIAKESIPSFSYHPGAAPKDLALLFDEKYKAIHLFEQYHEVASGIADLYKQHHIGRNQVQPIYFDQMRDMQKFLRYLTTLHNEDLIGSCQDALRWTFQNRFLEQRDRAQIEELILKFHLDYDEEISRIDPEYLYPDIVVTGEHSLKSLSDAFIPELQRKFEKLFLAIEIGNSIIVGRHPDCHLVVDHGSVSRRHFQITRLSDTIYEVEDLNSRNGTKVNGRSIDFKTRLAPDDSISIVGEQFIIPRRPINKPRMPQIPKLSDESFLTEASKQPEVYGLDTQSSLSPEDLEQAKYHEVNVAFTRPGAHGSPASWAGGDSGSLESSEVKGLVPTAEYVSFLGTELSKVTPQGPRHIPVSFFEGDVHTEFDLRLLRDIATCFKIKEIPLLEGGPGLGKSRILARIASFRGQEFYEQIARQCPVKYLFGKLVPTTADGSRFEYKPGLVTLACQQGGLLHIAEYNALLPEARIFMRDLQDAYRNGDTHFTLSLSGEPIHIPIHKDFAMAFSQNEWEPGEECLSRVEEADFNRAMYFKLPDELPKYVLQGRMLGMMGYQPELQIRKFEFYDSSQPLDRDGIAKLLGSPAMARRVSTVYRKFFLDLQTQLGADLAQGRNQPVFLNYERNFEKTLKFFQSHYNGDPLQSFRQAIYYVHCNLFESEAERKIVRTTLKTALASEPS
ncbi:MAG: FHA domain-containing protein, partial [Bdellovibrionales bacterium]|nr:FHA domain-containing protein [Bdellovibrionales bacterium]